MHESNSSGSTLWNPQPHLRESFVSEDTVVEMQIIETMGARFFLDR
jgi:hypothetical protein